MNRLTTRNSDGAWDVPIRNDDDGAYIPSQEIIDRLAAYEDTGLEPEKIEKANKVIVSAFNLATNSGTDILIRRLKEIIRAEAEGRLLVLPCGDDVTLEYNGLIYRGDHWNPPTLTAFAADPSMPSGLRLHWFSIEDAEKALGGMELGVSK